MTARATLTQATIRRAISAARKEGMNTVAIRPDGTIFFSQVENPISDVPLAPKDKEDAEASRWGDE